MRRRTWLLAIAIASCSGCDGSADVASVRLGLADLQARESAFDGQMVELAGVCLVANRQGDVRGIYRSSEGRALGRLLVHEVTLHSPANSPD